MTPRQIAAWSRIADMRRRRDRADDLAQAWLAASGDQKAVNKQMRALTFDLP